MCISDVAVCFVVVVWNIQKCSPNSKRIPIEKQTWNYKPNKHKHYKHNQTQIADGCSAKSSTPKFIFVLMVLEILQISVTNFSYLMKFYGCQKLDPLPNDKVFESACTKRNSSENDSSYPWANIWWKRVSLVRKLFCKA